MFVIRYITTTLMALLTLTLFDDNPWWITALFSLVPTLINTKLNTLLGTRAQGALIKAVFAAFLAFLFGMALPIFRTTFGTLVGFTLLLALAEYLLQPFLQAANFHK